MKETILVFGIEDNQRKAQLKQALLPLQLKVKRIHPADYDLTLGMLCGIEKEIRTEEQPHQELPEPMIIFCGLPESKLSRALSSLRSRGLIITHKAILTDTNRSWTPFQCFLELKREHEAIEEQQKRH